MSKTDSSAFKVVYDEVHQVIARLIAHPGMQNQSADMLFDLLLSTIDFHALACGVDTTAMHESLLKLAAAPEGADIIARGQAQRIHARALGNGW